MFTWRWINWKDKTKKVKPKQNIINDESTNESDYESEDEDPLLLKNIDNNNTNIIIKKVRRKLKPDSSNEPILFEKATKEAKTQKIKPKSQRKNKSDTEPETKSEISEISKKPKMRHQKEKRQEIKLPIQQALLRFY